MKSILMSNRISSLLFIFVWVLLITTEANQFILSTSTIINEDEFNRELNECTTGLASGYATPDGRPLLWKTRDCNSDYQEFHYVDDGRIPFISQVTRSQNDLEPNWKYTEYFGGVNAAGFALENSNSYNLGDEAPGRDDDGCIIYLGLATCRTVEDFARILDSTNIAGRTLNANYGTFDAFGGAVMYETGGYSYTAVNAVEAPDGFVVRSNFSYSGNLNRNKLMGAWG